MKGKAGLHIIVLLIAIILTFLWVSDNLLANYSLQATAVLLLSMIAGKRILTSDQFKLAESVITTIAVLLVVAGTGGLISPFFFLNFFLLFALSFLLEPVIPLALSVFLIIFYLLTNDLSQARFQLIELAAFPFMTPLAYFFGKIYQKEENQKIEIKNLSKKIERLEEELVEEEINNNPIN